MTSAALVSPRVVPADAAVRRATTPRRRSTPTPSARRTAIATTTDRRPPGLAPAARICPTDGASRAGHLVHALARSPGGRPSVSTTENSGRRLTSVRICATYSPRIPVDSAWKPSRNANSTTTVAWPGTSSTLVARSTTPSTAPTIDSAEQDEAEHAERLQRPGAERDDRVRPEPDELRQRLPRSLADPPSREAGRSYSTTTASGVTSASSPLL